MFGLLGGSSQLNMIVLAGVLLIIGGLCVFFIKETYAEKADPETERFDEI